MPAILAVAFTALPLAASAGENFAPSPAMAQMDSQMHQLSVQARTAVLQAITPQHRQLLAQIVGGLAIAPDPDYAAASRQLNAALSQQEAQSVLRISTQFHQQMRTLMQTHIQQMEANEPKAPGATSTRHDEVFMGGGVHGGAPGQMDAGTCLLMLAQSGMGMMHRVMIEKSVVH
ncbi:MAG TPA: hypothetical protein VJN22_02240 [Candidatus Eremiobacteraceae bacterium]|nr:hypothetical protein [Candidatus Eremiobacteraceae bacterium]